MKYIVPMGQPSTNDVALLVSAWIEICTRYLVEPMGIVALLVSAWIEIPTVISSGLPFFGRTPRECVD